MAKLKIATYNIHKDEGDFPKRIYKIADILVNMDIVCFQEDYESKYFSSSKTINETLALHRVSTITRQKDRAGIVSSSNLTILSKHPIRLLDVIYFNMGESEERACQICEINIDDKKIIITNTHLCHISSDNRKTQIKKILSKLKKYKADMFLFCGDLNATPNSKEIQKIAKDFDSANKESTYEDGSILDYIFIKSDLNLKVESITIPCNLSDHFCLINKIKIK